jgi:hypothetical protein
MAHRPRPRTIIGPDGTPHIRYGVRRDYVHDLYHYLMRAAWPTLVALFAVAFTGANLIFALAYMLDVGLQNARPGHFSDDLSLAFRP